MSKIALPNSGMHCGKTIENSGANLRQLHGYPCHNRDNRIVERYDSRWKPSYTLLKLPGAAAGVSLRYRDRSTSDRPR